METFSVVNGEPCDTIEVGDRGLAYGHGVFETIKYAGGGFPLWHYHARRLRRGLDILRIPCEDSRVRASLDQVRERCPRDGVVKLTVTAGTAGRGYAVSGALSPTVIARWFPAAAPDRAPVELAVSGYRLPVNPALAGIKHLNRLDQVLAASDAPTGFQPLLLDVTGRVVETLSHNIFVLHRGWWLTPALDRCGVEGVMRAVLLEQVFTEAGAEVSVDDFDLDVLSGADEVFICNSVDGIRPVTAIAGRGSGYGSVETGKIMAKLAEVHPCFTV